MRHPRILNRAAQAKEPEGLEEGTMPRRCLPRGQTRPRALEAQPAESSFDVLVDIGEVVRRIPRAKVLSPAAEHRIHVRDDAAEVTDLSDITDVLGTAGLDGSLSTVPLTVRSVFPWPDLIETFDPNARTSYWWRNAEHGRMHSGFTHEGALDATLFSTLFGTATNAGEQSRPLH